MRSKNSGLLVLCYLLLACPKAVFADPAEEGWSEPEGGTVQPEPAESGWERRGHERVRLAYALRPLTMPRGMFDVGLTAGLLGTRGAPFSGQLVASARYGLDDQQELGLTLWPVTIQQDGLTAGPMTLLTVRRFYQSAAFEVGGLLSGTVPFGPQQLAFDLAAPMLFRLGPRLRADLSLDLGLDLKGQTLFRLGVPWALSGQLTQVLRLALRSETTVVPQLRTARASLGLEAVVTFAGEQGAAADLGIHFEWPRLLGHDDLPAFSVDRWVVGLSARFFVPITRRHESSFDF